MDETKALDIVSALADGINPLTGEAFPADSPYQSPDIVRALFIARTVVEARARVRQRTPLPGNAGKPWSEEEDRKLLLEFDRGGSIAELAQLHARTAAGIQARLEKHGRVQPQSIGRSFGYSRRGQQTGGVGGADARTSG